MTIRRLACWASISALCVSLLPEPARAGGAPELDVAQILERNAAARGGLEAWRKTQTMVWGGRVERGDGSGVGMPFMFFQKRPNRTRFEIVVDKAKAVRVFD